MYVLNLGVKGSMKILLARAESRHARPHTPGADVDLDRFRRSGLPLLLPLGLWFARGLGLVRWPRSARLASLPVPSPVLIAASLLLLAALPPGGTWNS